MLGMSRAIMCQFIVIVYSRSSQISFPFHHFFCRTWLLRKLYVQAVGQICSTASMAHNLKQCRQLVAKAASAGAKVSNPNDNCSSQPFITLIQALFLPEASDYIGFSAAETVSLAKSVQESEFVLGLQDEARKSKLHINVGIHEPAEGGQKVKNTLIWIDERGDIVQRYQKLHLFDVEIKGGPILKESQFVLCVFRFSQFTED
ncbi:Nitrilase/cyanide hydratase and apolipoprotein N-acyltransferase [Macrophomina phaseolina MS6]|uniref:Nitrilase/cyanide hydratase and apolipoprotein N-acyltransferase n=1 Tax=Macrophomina phaseolina (strain MS6) TaxID=1126212 RepID=K2SRZ7_MACPH|nr:Nitrilase/cyanide hydratase and apolipoprotein N-acyltransferase [Macrophomina phaseolina MS6]